MKRLFHRFGLDVKRVGSLVWQAELGPLEVALTVLLSERKFVNIVQIGANDGRVNDPIYPFATRYPDRTHLLLIEPQAQLIPSLSENYEFHTSKTIVRVAVGAEGILDLFSVSPDAWPYLNVPYARGWPEYRAPTGITSVDKAHVARWLNQYLDSRISVEDAIVRIQVESKALVDIIDEAEYGRFVDVLQVDTEGFDDQVIYHSSLDLLRPPIINFEHENLDEERVRTLFRYLRHRGYVLIRDRRDTLCLRTTPPNQPVR